MFVGGAEVVIILFVLLVVLAPTLVVGLIVWLAMASKSKNTAPLAPAGWMADPSGRHEQRYWDGAVWTAHVSDAGVQAIDPV